MIYERGIFSLKNSVMLSKSSRGQLALFIFRSFSMFDVEGKRGRQKTEARIPAGVMEEMESVMLSSRDAQMCGTFPGSWRRRKGLSGNEF